MRQVDCAGLECFHVGASPDLVGPGQEIRTTKEKKVHTLFKKFTRGSHTFRHPEPHVLGLRWLCGIKLKAFKKNLDGFRSF